MKTLLTSVFCFLLFTLTAQHKYDWSKYDSLPFKEDSVQSFNNTQVQNHIIYSIKESKADIEIRFYSSRYVTTEGNVYTIKYFKDTILTNRYDYRYVYWTAIGMGNYEFMGRLGGKNGTDICRRVISLPIKTNLTSKLDTAIKYNLLTLRDSKAFSDSVIKKQITLNATEYNCADCDGFILCELKVGNKYRNFRIWARAKDYYATNKGDLSLKYYSELLKLIDTVFR